jgi:MATE family multidrug resistance protein
MALPWLFPDLFSAYCIQAFGARNYSMLGTVYQRAQVICWAMCIPIALLYHHMTPILLALGQHPDIVALATQYLRILIPGLFLLVVNETTRRYFLAQRVVTPGMVTYLITSALSPLYNWLFIYRWVSGHMARVL